MVPNIHRLANLLQFNNLSKDNFWSLIKNNRVVAYDNTFKWCHYDGLFKSDDDKLDQVMGVEKELQTESSELRYENMTSEDLKTAAEMFIYLNLCPLDNNDINFHLTTAQIARKLWFKSWSFFYVDLFLSQSADHIILTLNRMMKTETSQDKDDIIRAEKMLQRTSDLLSLNYEQIQSMMPGQKVRNGSVKNKNLKIQNGNISI